MVGRLLVDGSTARPIVIFGPGDLGREAFTGETRGTECLPFLPTLVMTRGVREAIAVGLGFVQWAASGHVYSNLKTRRAMMRCKRCK